MSEGREMVESMPAKSYRPWNPYQGYLVPPSPLDWLPEDHLAYFVLELVQTLDLSEIEMVIQSKEPRGERPYSPQMMVALLLYGYSVGVFSSRKIAQATYDYVAFRVLAGDTHPYFTTINQFRLNYHEALARLFLQGLKLCQKAGLVKLGHVSLDGSKIQANASKHKAMSYERMEKEEARLKAEIEAMLRGADEIDREEDERYGREQDAQDLPEELRLREKRLARIKEAKVALEKEAAKARAEALREQAKRQREKAADESVDPVERKRSATRAEKSEEKARALDDRDGEDDPPVSGSPTSDDLPHHRVQTTPDGAPAAKAQRNFTDADSRIMKKGGDFLQGYNAQIVADAESQVIVAESLTNQAPDQEHLVPMIDRAIENCEEAPKLLSADSGYFSKDNVDACEQRGINPYIAVARKNDAGPSGENDTKAQTAAQEAKQRMREKLQSDAGKAIYARRKVIVEPPFGQIKETRGFRRFSLRGLTKARSEWTLVCLTHNLLKLFRATGSAISTGYTTPVAIAASPHHYGLCGYGSPAIAPSRLLLPVLRPCIEKAPAKRASA
jgi:transposase